MIGILAKLAKAAKLAQTAEAAIDVATNKLDSKPAGSAPAAEKSEGEVPEEFRAMLESGVPDPRELLPAAKVEEIIGKPVRSVSLAATDDCVVCDYNCKDRAGTVLGLHLSTSMAWDEFDSEIAKKEVFDDLGDSAFRGGRQIYVKAGETVFWIHTAGEVMVNMAVEAARAVLAQLAE